MSLLLQLLGVVRHCRHPWVRPQLHAAPSALRSTAAAAAGGAALLLAPPLAARQSSSRTATDKGLLAPAQPAHQNRCVSACAGRRGNVFLDDLAAEKLWQPTEDEREPPLFDSSRFNYDSDEEDGERQDVEADKVEEQQEEQKGGTAASAAATQQQQQRWRRRVAVPGAGADAVGEEVVKVALSPPRGVKVKRAEFVKSSVSVDQCPPARYPEFAVIGRSNVGKSSLINMLTGRNSLALVSKTPGKTRCINHFVINGTWFLVDLPGYGYARTSKGNVVEWNRFTREYFVERETLVAVLLLVDASIPPMALDVACATWFAEAEIPFTVVFTKLDKRKKGGSPAEDNIAAFEKQVAEACGYAPPTIATSSRSGKGRNELLAHVAQLRDFFNKSCHGM